ncbi:MAG: prepilin-type N-terminal cleavage/methylation domain-containing protein [Planctomycetota bacterium]|nr:prepilin-type N-terminal cleavage/methylation domain-containing protein [Planctomycetota bacterium]
MMTSSDSRPVINRRAHSTRGFTLVELVVASVIAVIIAGATATAMSQMIKARGASTSHQQAFSRADGVATRISIDLLNAIRNANLAYCRVSIISSGAPNAPRDELLVLMRSLRPLRGESSEGDEYEAQYRIAPAAAADGTVSDTFWRRVDQAHDEVLDGGGIATPIAPGAVSLSFTATDGQDWFDDWDSDTDGLPHAVRVVVVARSDDGKTTATARRVVAIDRVPIAPVDETDTSGTDSSGSTKTPSSTGTGGSGTGTGGTGTGGTGTRGTGSGGTGTRGTGGTGTGGTGGGSTGGTRTTGGGGGGGAPR